MPDEREIVELTEEDKRICAALFPIVRRRGGNYGQFTAPARADIALAIKDWTIYEDDSFHTPEGLFSRSAADGKYRKVSA